jgi:lipid II:glycine glycyltransferase (peptidoglycan interpeptide bridge formation enzyme)
VAADPAGDPLQSWAWGETVSALDRRQRVARLLVEGPDGRIVGLAALLVRDAPFGRRVLYAPHGPLWDRTTPAGPAILEVLLAGIRALAVAERGIVVKLDPRAEGGPLGPAWHATPGLRRARHDLQARTTRVVTLADGGAGLMASWHPKARRQVRRAGRGGVTIEIVRSAEPAAMAAFHGVYAATAQRARFRARSAAFLERLGHELALRSAAGRPGPRADDAPLGCYLALAGRDGRVLAGICAPRVGDRAYCLYGGSVRGPGLQGAFAADAVLAGLMAALARDGVRTLDLWGVAEPGDPAADPAWRGFSRQKLRFGGMALRHPGTFDLVVAPAWYDLRELRERLGDGLSRRGRAEDREQRR